MFATDRSRPPESCNNVVPDADKRSVSQNDEGPIKANSYNLHYKALEVNQSKNNKGKDTWKDPSFYSRSYSSSPVERWGTVDSWCDGQVQQWWPQRTPLYNMNDKIWKADYEEF